MQQFLNDVFNVFAHVTGFGQRSSVSDSEGNIQQTGQRFRKQRLTRTGRSDEQYVALAQLDFFLLIALVESLVMVVHSHSQDLLGSLLTNYVLVKDAADFLGCGQLLRCTLSLCLLHLLTDDVIAQVDALVADKNRGPGNQFAYFMLAFAAERAIEQLAGILAVAGVSHSIDPIGEGL